MSKTSVHWRRRPAPKDFEAVQRYLSLLGPPQWVRRQVRALRSAQPVAHVAKDLLRASGLPLLPRTEEHVQADLKRIHKGKPLSPVLLVQGDAARGLPLTVADGYHRICAICYYDEDTPVSCCLIPSSTSGAE
jgi:hypothetical protein